MSLTMLGVANNYIDRLRDEIERLKDRTTWQSIGTAPKDGTYFLASTGHDDDRPEVVQWVGWDNESGWYNGDWRHDPDHFTHWMPLPEPPQ